MSIYDKIPYTYLIGWKQHNKWYYGVRYAKGCHPRDLWKTYFTSSKLVKQLVKMFGDPDIIQVRRIFNCPIKACNWEITVLRRLNVPNNIKFLNGHRGGHGYNASIQSRKATIGVATVYDNNGNKHRVASNDPRILSGELSGNRKNKITVIKKETDEKVTITVNEYDKALYKHPNQGKKQSIEYKKDKALYYKDDKLVLMNTKEAKKLGLLSQRESTSIYKNKFTNDVKILPVDDPLVISGEFVGINTGKKLNSKPKENVVCEITTKKEFTLGNWIQHERKLTRPKKKSILYSCVCDITTKKHYDKASWNRFIASPKIDYYISNKDTYHVEIEKFL